MGCLKSIIKCFYQSVFKFGQFLHFKFTYLLYLEHFWPLRFIFHSLRLNKINLGKSECLECIITCFYQFVFKFGKGYRPLCGRTSISENVLEKCPGKGHFVLEKVLDFCCLSWKMSWK